MLWVMQSILFPVISANPSLLTLVLYAWSLIYGYYLVWVTIALRFYCFISNFVVPLKNKLLFITYVFFHIYVYDGAVTRSITVILFILKPGNRARGLVGKSSASGSSSILSAPCTVAWGPSLVPSICYRHSAISYETGQKMRIMIATI